MKKIILAIIALAALSAGAWFFFGPEKEGEVEVLATARVERAPVRKVLEATGIVKARVGAQVKIGAQATGVIEKMLVKVGDPVDRGEMVAVIDDRDLQAQKAREEATLARNRAELERVEQVYPLQIEEAEAELALAEAEASYAGKNLERQEHLVTRDLEARDVLDKAESDARVAGSRVAARRAALSRLKKEFSRVRAKAGKDVRQAEAALASVEVRISYTRIRSPMAGVVSQVTAQEGETVVSGLQVSNLVTVLDPDRLEMWIYVDETDVGQVETGMDVEFTVDAYPDRVFEGRIDRIYPQPEIRDNIVYYQAIVNLDHEQAKALRPEMTTQCKVVVEKLEDALSIPNTALKWVGDERVVFAMRGGVPERVLPEFGLQGLTRSQVLSGLSEGEEVATRLTLPAGGSGAR